MLEPDVEAFVSRLMRERRLTLDEAINDGFRAGMAGPRAQVSFPTYDLGEPLVDLTKALHLAGELEDHGLGHQTRPDFAPGSTPAVPKPARSRHGA